MMGERDGGAGGAVLQLQPGAARAGRSLAAPIDRFVDLSGIREELKPFYSKTGAPLDRSGADDPDAHHRLLHGHPIRAAAVRDEVHLNRAYRWFCRLGLDGDVPDHSTFSKTRHGRFRDSDLLRRLFETTVARCMAEGLVGGERVRGRRQPHPRRCQSPDRRPGSDGLAPDADTVRYASIWPCSTIAHLVQRHPVVPKYLAPADPAARWTSAHRGPALLCLLDQTTHRPRPRRHHGRGSEHRCHRRPKRTP